MKKLFKDQSTKMICGVCSGLAQYFNIDATIVRLVWAIVAILTAILPFVLIYIVCAIVLPDKSTVA